MTVEAVFEKFELFTDTVGAVEKLRECVLSLAIRGRLVDQNPDDEPADILFSRILAERDVLVDAKQIRPRHLSGPIAADDVPFSIPASWQWHRLADLCFLITDGAHHTPTYHECGVPFLSVKDVSSGEIDFSSTRFISAQAHRELCKRCKPERGDILLTKVGTTGIAVTVEDDREFSIFVSLALLKFSQNNLDRKYLKHLINSPFVRKQSADNTQGIGNKNLVLRLINEFSVPVPPLAEQKRIVAKVDELMALCDRLEAEQQERETKHAALARASLARFAEAPTPANLQFLFHKSYDITPADLRKTILTLAVQGKLVPQHPDDGNARELVDRAMQKRDQTITAKKLRQKQPVESSKIVKSKELPTSWCVELLANLVDPENTISYGVLVPGNDVADGIPFVRAQDISLSNHAERPNKTIAPSIEKPYARTRLTGGEILLCVVGSIGKLGIAPASWAGANIARAVARIKPIEELNRDYLLIVLQETTVQAFFTSSTRTLAQPTLNVGLIEQTPIPVPPLSEQRRIVAKVAQLMELVNALEKQLAESRAAGEKLMEAVVDELTVAGA